MSANDFNERPSRKRPVHAPILDSGNRSVIVFLTVCTKKRAPVLATPTMHQALIHAWRQASFWLIGRYVVMPDHIHLFCGPGTIPPHSLENWVRFWKSAVAKTVDAGPDTLWEKNFWDTQLRRGESYQQKWSYVLNNPVRANLVTTVADWPYQGELEVLRWHR